MTDLDEVIRVLEKKTPRGSFWEPGFWEPGLWDECQELGKAIRLFEKGVK